MMFVEEEFTTLQKIIKDKCSIARYGDGEYKLAVNLKCNSQVYVPYIGERLREILKLNTKDSNFIVCIPRIKGRWDLKKYNCKLYKYWNKYNDSKYTELLNKSNQYYSSFITRWDNALHIDCDDFWNLWKKVWENKDVVLIRGSHKFREKTPLFENIKSLQLYSDFPEQDAGLEYEKILQRILNKNIPKTSIILLSLGPTATILSYDLYKLGYHVLDVGHLEMFHRKRYKECQN